MLVKKKADVVLKLSILILVLFSSCLRSYANEFEVGSEEALGQLQVQKVSNKEGAALSGSVFGIFTSASQEYSEFVSTLIVGADGLTNEISLPAGVYYIKEESTLSDFEKVEVKAHQKTLVKITSSKDVIIPFQLFGVNGGEYTSSKSSGIAGLYAPADEAGAWKLMGSTKVFCMQPYIFYWEGYSYTASTTKPNYLSATDMKMLSRISYYGTKYTPLISGKENLYRAATQTAISYYIYDHSTHDGARMQAKSDYLYTYNGKSVKPQVDEIMNLVNTHTIKPSFNGKTYNVTAGQTLTLTDTNNVFERYNTSTNDNITQSKNGNTWKLTIGENVKPGDTITLTFKHKANSNVGTTLIYRPSWLSTTADYLDENGLQICGEFFVGSDDVPSGSIKLVVQETMGELQIKKTSSHPNITENHPAYDLVGATYGVFSDESATSKVGELIIDQSLYSNKLSLKAGDYWLKELVAPMGYQLDETIYPISLKAGELLEKELSDVPQTQTVDLLIKKVDEETNEANSHLENAEFVIAYYPSMDETKEALRTWTMKTDNQGYVKLEETYKVTGDDFYYLDGQSNPCLPLGRYVIYESKAPQGYHLNSEKFIVDVKMDEKNEMISLYQPPIVKDLAISLKIHKVQEESNITVSGVTFRHTFPDGNKENLTTDQDGEIQLVGMKVGIHTLQEISTIDGLALNKEVFKFEVLDDGSCKALSTSANMHFENDEHGNGNLTVTNQLAPFIIKINKVNQHKEALEGANFTLYEDEACLKEAETKTTDAKGELLFEKLKVGKKYYLKETKAPEGYQLTLDENGEVHLYEIYVEASPAQGIFEFYVDQKKYTTSDVNGIIHLEGTPTNRIVSILVTNNTSYQLPVTGSASLIIYLMVGMLVYGLGMLLNKENNRKGELK